MLLPQEREDVHGLMAMAAVQGEVLVLPLEMLSLAQGTQGGIICGAAAAVWMHTSPSPVR